MQLTASVLDLKWKRDRRRGEREGDCGEKNEHQRGEKHRILEMTSKSTSIREGTRPRKGWESGESKAKGRVAPCDPLLPLFISQLQLDTSVTQTGERVSKSQRLLCHTGSMHYYHSHEVRLGGT